MQTSCRKLLAYFFVLCCPIFLLSACLQAPTSKEAAGTILFSDDFENTTDDWTERLDEDGSMIGHQAGGLRFVVNTNQRDKISTLKPSQDDAIIAVDAMKLNGSNDNLFGIVCRWQDAGNYYTLLISSDAYFGIAKVEDGVYQMLSNDYMEINEEVIQQGTQNNTLRAGCVQNALWLEVNGTVLAGIYDDTFSSGEIGLMAGSTSQAGVDILFDNFSLTQP